MEGVKLRFQAEKQGRNTGQSQCEEKRIWLVERQGAGYLLVVLSVNHGLVRPEMEKQLHTVRQNLGWLSEFEI